VVPHEHPSPPRLLGQPGELDQPPRIAVLTDVGESDGALEAIFVLGHRADSLPPG